MNLSTAKQLADLEEQKTALASKLGEKINQKLHELTTQAFNDFETLFKEQSFEVSHAERSICATYKSLKAQLSHSDPSEPLIGVYLRFDLILQLSGEKEAFIIFLNPKSKTQFLNSISSNNDEQKVLAEKQKLEQLQKRLDSFSDLEWDFELRKNNNSKHNPYQNTNRFDSMKELIESINESQ